MKHSEKYDFYREEISIRESVYSMYQEEIVYLDFQDEIEEMEGRIKLLKNEIEDLTCKYAQLLFEELSQLNPEVIEKGSGKAHTFQGIFGNSFSKLTLAKMQNLIDTFEGKGILKFNL